ncbi:MAG: hypothetical protein LBJ72_01560 [Dysgonamonadaceae bacterium]|jgi:hypothetical protein|nr:hypothetical protein [Dysgonamonadaceae bacterium]
MNTLTQEKYVVARMKNGVMQDPVCIGTRDECEKFLRDMERTHPFRIYNLYNLSTFSHEVQKNVKEAEFKDAVNQKARSFADL